MIKYSEPDQQEELREGIGAIERVNGKVNEAIRKVDMSKVTEDLLHRVEDWKGHRLDQFGSLLLNGQFTVIKGDGKGDLEREVSLHPSSVVHIVDSNIMDETSVSHLSLPKNTPLL